MPALAPKYDYVTIARRREAGHSWAEIAEDVGSPDAPNLTKLFSRWRRSAAGKAYFAGQETVIPREISISPETFREAVQTERPALPEKWPFPVRPIQVSIAAPPARPATLEPADGLFRVIHLPDIHVPFHDGRALGVVYDYLAQNRMDAVVCHGDLIDAYPISSYDKDHTHRISQQEELELAAAVLGRITQLTPYARWRKYFEGNHEHRLTRQLNKMARDRSIGEILDLKLVREALSWPVLLDLGTLGWTYHTTRETLFNRLILKHGDIVRKHAGYTARAELDKYHRSGMSGHTHRIGRVTQSDHNGVHAWWEIGCLCDLTPDYVSDPNWQHGFAISTWDLSDPERPQYQVDQINIHDGRAIVHGRIYSAPDTEETL